MGTLTGPIIRLIRQSGLLLPLLDCNPQDFREKCKVLVNGIWIGATDRPGDLHQMLRTARQYHDIPFDTSVTWLKTTHRNQLLVNTDAGAFLHPVLVVDKLHLVRDLHQRYGRVPTVFWDMLMSEGVIEFLEKEEEETCRVAMRLSDLKTENNSRFPYTHSQIHPDLMFGIAASLIPFPEHNQAPRNMYQCIDATEPIRMADGSVKPLGDVKVGDSILTFDPETLRRSITKVVYAFSQPTDKPMVRVTVDTGQHIMCTTDHLFMTSQGWKAPQEFESHKTLIAMAPTDFVYFATVTEVVPIPRVIIADITTESANHSFITSSGFCVHNSSMGKQAIGAPASNFLNRPESKMQILDYPQRPIVSTFASYLLGHDALPPMANVKCMVGSYTGYNQEDSVILNRAAVDRGLFRSTCFQTFKDMEKAGGTTDRDVFEKPDRSKTLGMQHANYDKLNPEDGIIDVGTRVEDADAIIGKVMLSGASQKKNKPDTVIRDRSTLWKSIETGVVDQVMMSSGILKEDMRTARVRIRSQRIPEIGDKFSSRHGQVRGKQSVMQEGMLFTLIVHLQTERSCWDDLSA